MTRHMQHRRPLAAFLLLLAVLPASAGNTVYSWKDAEGRLHFSDTPPPPGATLIRGPAPKPPAGENACPPDTPPADCRTARKALREDLDSLSTDTDAANRRASPDADAAKLVAKECADLRATRAALERRRDGRSSEILTDAERRASSREAIDRDIAQIDLRLVQLCR